MACRETGLPEHVLDAGPDPDFRPLLRSFVGSLRHDARLTLVGRALMKRNITRLLANRLRVLDDHRRELAIAATPIKCPLFIIGFPRTGTTLLHSLLAQDPENRAPAFWEVMWPSPQVDDDRGPTRRQRAQRVSTMASRVAPHMRAIHAVKPTGPEECYFIFQMALATPVTAQVNARSYLEYVRTVDFRGPYQFHRQVLQRLQPGAGVRWVLKAPMHLHNLDALLAVYPDARVIRTHRALPVVAGSGCSLYHATRRLYSNHVDPLEIGRDWLHLWGESTQRFMQARAQAQAEQFVDLRYEDLTRAPIEQVEKVYAQFDMSLSDCARANMVQWLARNPKGKHGTHVYQLSSFGLDEATLKRRFGTYVGAYVEA